jgi:hypothetical protein
MHEYNVKDITTAEIYKVPIGPFFNYCGTTFNNPQKLYTKSLIDLVDTITYTFGKSENSLQAERKSINRDLYMFFVLKYNIFTNIISYLFDNPLLPKSSAVHKFSVARYACIPYSLTFNIENANIKAKYLNATYVRAENPNSTTTLELYNGPLWNGSWRWAFADLLLTDQPKFNVPVSQVQVGLPTSVILSSDLPQVGLPTIGLPTTHIPIFSSTYSSYLPLPHASIGTPAGSGIGLSVKPPSLNTGTNGKHGGKYNIIRNTRRNNRIKRRNIRNTRGKNMKLNKINRINNTKMNINNDMNNADYIKPYVVTNKGNTKDIMFLQQIKPGAVKAHNEMVKMGLLDNLFIKLSGRPLKYKTAN